MGKIYAQLLGAAAGLLVLLGLTLPAGGQQIDKPSLRVAVPDWYPWGWVQADGTVGGIHSEVLTPVAESLGLDVEFMALPIKRLVRGGGRHDFDYFMAYDSDALFPESRRLAQTGCTDVVVISTTDKPVRSLADLRRLRVALPLGGYIAEIRRAVVPVAVEVPNSGELFMMLDKGRFDAMAIDSVMWNSYRTSREPYGISQMVDWSHFVAPLRVEPMAVALRAIEGRNDSRLNNQLAIRLQDEDVRARIRSVYRAYGADTADSCTPVQLRQPNR